MRPVFQSSVMRRAMLSPMPRTSVRVPASMIPPRSEVRLSSARAAFSYARTLKGFSPLSSRRPAISSRMRATSRTSTRNSVRDWFARGGLGKLGQRPSTGESFLGRMPVHDLRLAETPAEADHPVARHGVEVDQPQVEILEDASVRGDLVQRGAELLEQPRAPRLVLAERAHVLTPARRARGLDGDQHPHLPLERRDLPGHRRERSQGLREIGNQTVRFFHREDLVPDSFHTALARVVDSGACLGGTLSEAPERLQPAWESVTLPGTCPPIVRCPGAISCVREPFSPVLWPRAFPKLSRSSTPRPPKARSWVSARSSATS